MSFAQKFKEVFKATTGKRLACAVAGPSQGPRCGLLQVISSLPATQSSHGFGTSATGERDRDPQHQRDVRLCWGMAITPSKVEIQCTISDFDIPKACPFGQEIDKKIIS